MKWVKVSHWNSAVFFSLRGSFEHGLPNQEQKKGVTVFSANWSKWALLKYWSQWEMAKIWKQISFLVKFCLKCFHFFIFHRSMVKETIGAKRGHWIGFKIISLFVLKIVLADTSYIEVQYTKIKNALANRSSARATAPLCGAKDVRMRSLYAGTIMLLSPAWILLPHADLLKRGWRQSPGAWSVSVSGSSQFNKWAVLI